MRSSYRSVLFWKMSLFLYTNVKIQSHASLQFDGKRMTSVLNCRILQRDSIIRLTIDVNNTVDFFNG